MQFDIISSDETEVSIFNQYWLVDAEGAFQIKVADIAETHSVTASEVSGLAKVAGVAYSDLVSCVTCEEGYQYKNRQDYISVNRYPNKEWECDYCISSRLEDIEKTKKSHLVESLTKAQEEPINERELSAEELITLVSLIRGYMGEELVNIKNISSFTDTPLTPYRDYDVDLVSKLFSKKLIVINPNTDLRSIVVEDEKISFYLNKVDWLLPLNDEVQPCYYVELLEQKIRQDDFVSENIDEIKSLATEVSIKECVSYLEHLIEEYNLSFTAGDKTKLIISRALNSFSVAQMFCLIWQSCKDAASFYMKGTASKKHAANVAVSSLEKKIERALTNGWEVKAYGRNYDFPQSYLSSVLFNSVLKTDDGGFTSILSDLFPENEG
jgi:hypothetical protein